MPLPYRTVLKLPPETALVQLAEQEVQTWLEGRRKVDRTRRMGFVSGAFFEPGIHQLGHGRTLTVVRLNRGRAGEQLLKLRFVEKSKVGTWQVDIVAVDSSEGSPRADTLIIEARRIDSPEAEGEVDPPFIVSQLLARESVLDGRTPVTPEPRMIDPSGVSEVFDSITDPDRSVSVIVASSVGAGTDENLRLIVKQLTAKITGLAAVFVLSSSATAALNALLPSSHRVEQGRVRTYLPNVMLDSPLDSRRHRVLGPKTFSRAIVGRKVSPYLQAAFALQTRSALLAAPLPRLLRRQLISLDEELLRLTRDIEIEKEIEVAKDKSRREVSASAISEGTAIDRLGRMLARWLRRDVGNIELVDVEEFSDIIDRQRVLNEAQARDIVEATERAAQLQERFDSFFDEFEYRGLELAEAERIAGKREDEIRYLRRELAAAGRTNAAFAPFATDEWDIPDDLSELALKLTPNVSDHSVVDRVVFTGDFSKVAEADLRDQNGLYVQRCWEFVRVLYDYAERRATGTFAGNVHSYLQSTEHDGFKIAHGRHAPTETKLTMDQWGSERLLPVPVAVDSSGRVLMGAHFKAGQDNSFAPRLHYFDDMDNTGKIYVGYIGRHLTNTKTKNA